MADLEIATSDSTYVFRDTDVVTIGRRDDNRVIVRDPTVSREHAVARFESGSWVLEDLTGGRTFAGGQAFSRLTLTGGEQRVNLATPTGPLLSFSTGRVDATVSLGVTAAPVPPPHTSETRALSAPPAPPQAVEQPPAMPQPSIEQPPAMPQPAMPQPAMAQPAMAQPESQPPPAHVAQPPDPQITGVIGAQQQQQQWTPFRQATSVTGGPIPQAGGAVGHQVAAGGNPFANVDVSRMKKALFILFPYRYWIENAGWRQGARPFFILYAILPVLFDVLFINTSNFETLGWVYAFYTAPLWLFVFWKLIRPVDSPRTLLIHGAVVSAVVLLIMAGPLKWWYNTVPDPQKHASDWFAWLIAPGFAEEATKDGAVLLTVVGLYYYFKTRLSVRGVMFLGTIAGLAFGAREAALYQHNDVNLFTPGASQNPIIQYVLLFSLRIFTDGLQHAEWAGIACFFIGLGMRYQRQRIPLILFGFAFGAVIHATNDWSTGISKWLWVVLQVLSATLFLGYTLFASTIEQQVSESDLFRGDSILMPQVAVDANGNPIAPGQGPGAGQGAGQGPSAGYATGQGGYAAQTGYPPQGPYAAQHAAPPAPQQPYTSQPYANQPYQASPGTGVGAPPPPPAERPPETTAPNN